MLRRLISTLLLAFWQLAGLWQAHSQDSYALPDHNAPCQEDVTSQKDQSHIDVTIAEISFWGSGIQMPFAEQNEIAESVQQLTHGGSVEDVTDEAFERMREQWQDRGYFKVQVTGEAKTLSSNPVSQRIGIGVHVEEGLQYSLREITFKHNKVISNVQALRALFPIKDGEIVSREKIAKGLDSLKRAYGDHGFINLVSMPEPRFDEANRLMSLDIDIDEGKQFVLRDIKVLGLEDAARQEVLNKFLLKSGDVYNERLYDLSLEQQALNIPNCPCRGVFRMDDKNGVVDIALDFRPCD